MKNEKKEWNIVTTQPQVDVFGFHDLLMQEIDYQISRELSIEEKLIINNYSVGYDFSYSQGSHFTFLKIEDELLHTILESILKIEDYEKLNQIEDASINYDKGCFIDKYGAGDEEDAFIQEIEEQVNDLFNDIEKIMYKKGYEIYEAEEEQEENQSIWWEFKKLNNIESNCDFWDLGFYSDKEKEGYTKIYENQYRELWVKLPKLKAIIRPQTIYIDEEKEE